MARPGKGPAKQSTLRIIGGRWRGRKFSFTPAEGLRPTPDRVRETLFNWLAPNIHGSRCLDLFAGSGALGLEALSRGAHSCDFVDTSKPALCQIDHHLQTLQARTTARCHALPALAFLNDADDPYDNVFIDPPFGMQLVDSVCEELNTGSLVKPGGFIYVEAAAGDSAPAVPEQWRLHREKKAGEVCYRLYQLMDT